MHQFDACDYFITLSVVSRFWILERVAFTPMGKLGFFFQTFLGQIDLSISHESTV